MPAAGASGLSRERVQRALERMLAGMEAGERLPPFRALAERLGVSREPVRQAVAALCAQGVLATRQGSGTWVNRPLAPTAAVPADRSLAVVVPTVAWPTIARLVDGAEVAARAHGCRLVLMQDHGDPAVQDGQLDDLAAGGFAGHLIWLDRDNVTRPECLARLRRLEAAAAPSVLIDRDLPGLALPSVRTDLARGMHEAVRHVVAGGRRRLGVLSWGEAAGWAEWGRLAGLRSALAEAGIAADGVRHARLGFAAGDARDQAELARREVAGWIAGGGGRPGVDAIIAFADEMAVGAYLALDAAGLRVPADVALCGFDDAAAHLGLAPGLALTTVAQPFQAMGRAAVDLLLAPPAGDGPRQILLPPRLVVRASTTAVQD